jgi:DNA-binding MarR family transcriptional regulator
MEDKGLVRRDACAGDKRGTFAVITPRGLATVERVAPRHTDTVRRHFIDQVPAPQLAQVATTLGPLLDRLGRVRDRD